MYDDWVDTATRELSKREIITKALAVVRAVAGHGGDGFPAINRRDPLKNSLASKAVIKAAFESTCSGQGWKKCSAKWTKLSSDGSDTAGEVQGAASLVLSLHS